MMKVLIAWNYQDVLLEAEKLNVQMTEKHAIDLLSHWREKIEKAMIAAGEEIIREAIEDFMIEYEDRQLSQSLKLKGREHNLEEPSLQEPETTL